jgi:2-amino-4-hydroxy-6-hydroxymethyldihydropteridine diphosphokinase
MVTNSHPGSGASTSAPRRVVLGLGANLGDRAGTLALAAREILTWGRGGLVSALYESAPHGPPQPDYLNAAVLIVTADAPERILARAEELEASLGRVRDTHWGPRTIDVDLLWADDEIVDAPTLVVPHRELLRRAFALLPLIDVVPDAVEPKSGLPLSHWLALVSEQRVTCTDRGSWADAR